MFVKVEHKTMMGNWIPCLSFEAKTKNYLDRKMKEKFRCHYIYSRNRCDYYGTTDGELFRVSEDR